LFLFKKDIDAKVRNSTIKTIFESRFGEGEEKWCEVNVFWFFVVPQFVN